MAVLIRKLGKEVGTAVPRVVSTLFSGLQKEVIAPRVSPGMKEVQLTATTLGLTQFPLHTLRT